MGLAQRKPVWQAPVSTSAMRLPTLTETGGIDTRLPEYSKDTEMGRMAKKHATTRLNLELSELSRQQLFALHEMTQANSLSDVVARALAAYEFIQNEKAKGNAIIVRGQGGNEREVVIL